MSGAARRSAGDSLLRIAQACETLLVGFNRGRSAAVGSSCLVSRQRAVSLSERHAGGLGGTAAGSSEQPRDLLLPLEDAMAQRRARPSLLLPAWRAVGFAVGTGTTALLPAEASAKVGEAIARAVTEQYDANIRTMYESRIEAEEIEVKNLFKTQRDEPSRAGLMLDPGDDETSGASTKHGEDARTAAVKGALKSAMRLACEVTSKI